MSVREFVENSRTAHALEGLPRGGSFHSRFTLMNNSGSIIG